MIHNFTRGTPFIIQFKQISHINKSPLAVVLKGGLFIETKVRLQTVFSQKVGNFKMKV